jgi:protein tyrosine/serine phosphatase
VDSEKKSQKISERRQKNSTVFVLIIVALVAGLIWLWEDLLEYRFVPRKLGIVLPGQIYRSGQISGGLIEEVLRRHQIGMVIKLNNYEAQNADHVAEKQAIQKLGIEYITFNLAGDGTGDVRSYVQAVEAIERARRSNTPVLVHCAAGAQRTGGTVALWRHFIQGWDVPEIMDELKQYGWKPHKNQALVEYLNQNIDHVGRQLTADGIIPAVRYPSIQFPVQAE